MIIDGKIVFKTIHKSGKGIFVVLSNQKRFPFSPRTKRQWKQFSAMESSNLIRISFTVVMEGTSYKSWQIVDEINHTKERCESCGIKHSSVDKYRYFDKNRKITYDNEIFDQYLCLFCSDKEKDYLAENNVIVTKILP